MQYLFAIIAGLVGWLFYSNTKKNSAEALLENNDANKKLNGIDKVLSEQQGLIAAEEDKRKEAEAKKNEDTSKSTIDFLNDRK